VTYLLALIAIATIVVLCWKAFGSERMQTLRGGADDKRVIGPDDDPEFLSTISREQNPDSDPGSSNER